MNEEIKRIILEQTDQRKAEMACEINSWGWPKELEQFIPEGYGVDGESWREGTEIMYFIEDIIGHKAFLKEWNKDRMTETEFEEWYKDAFQIFKE